MRSLTIVTSISLLLTVVFMSCEEENIISLGDKWDVYAIADSTDWAHAAPFVRGALEKEILTPFAEKEFVVHHVAPAEMDDYLNMRNLLIISALETDSRIDRILRRSLDAELYNRIVLGEEYLLVTKDQWANDQLVVIVAAPDKESLIANVSAYPDFLYNYFNDYRNQQLKENLFFHTQGGLEKQLKENYGWTMKIPFGYDLIDSSAQNRTVQLAKEEPDVNIFVHWLENARDIRMSEAWFVDQVNQLISPYKKAYLKDGYAFGQESDDSEMNALSMHGLWQSDSKYEGGPLFAYAFRDDVTNRIYIITTVVFAPDKRKEPHLREADVIVNTFKSFDMKKTES